MSDQIHSAIENVASAPERNRSGRKAAAAPTSAPDSAPSKRTARKPAANGAATAQPATASKAPASKRVVAAPATGAVKVVRKGPQPLMFRTGRNPQTFADAIVERRAAVKAAKEALKTAKAACGETRKTERKAFSEHRAAYQLLGAAIADTPTCDDGNKAEIAAAQETIKATKAAYAEAKKADDAALKAADKAKAIVTKAEEELKAILDAKATAQAAEKAA